MQAERSRLFENRLLCHCKPDALLLLPADAFATAPTRQFVAEAPKLHTPRGQSNVSVIAAIDVIQQRAVTTRPDNGTSLQSTPSPSSTSSSTTGRLVRAIAIAADNGTPHQSHKSTIIHIISAANGTSHRHRPHHRRQRDVSINDTINASRLVYFSLGYSLSLSYNYRGQFN